MVVLVMAILMLVGLEKAAVSEHVDRPVLCVWSQGQASARVLTLSLDSSVANENEDSHNTDPMW